jgi:hypothetical protein
VEAGVSPLGDTGALAVAQGISDGRGGVPACGSNDIDRDPAAVVSRVIGLRCLACGRTFTREPEVSCPRCQSKNGSSRSYEGWSYDDIDEARDNLSTAAWSSHDRAEFRCLDCNRAWRTSGPARPYEN